MTLNAKASAKAMAEPDVVVVVAPMGCGYGETPGVDAKSDRLWTRSKETSNLLPTPEATDGPVSGGDLGDYEIYLQLIQLILIPKVHQKRE